MNPRRTGGIEEEEAVRKRGIARSESQEILREKKIFRYKNNTKMSVKCPYIMHMGICRKTSK